MSARNTVLLATNPISERIVDDVTRYPLVIDKIVECKGGIVPDYMWHSMLVAASGIGRTTEGTRLCVYTVRVRARQLARLCGVRSCARLRSDWRMAETLRYVYARCSHYPLGVKSNNCRLLFPKPRVPE